MTVEEIARISAERDAAIARAEKAEMVVAMACDALNTFAREKGAEECQSPLGQDEAGLRSLAERLVLRLREKVARAEEQRDRARAFIMAFGDVGWDQDELAAALADEPTEGA